MNIEQTNSIVNLNEINTQTVYSKYLQQEEILFNKNNNAVNLADNDSEFTSLPTCAQKALSKIEADKMPNEILNVLSEVSDKFELSKSKIGNKEYKEREKFDGETSNNFQSGAIKENNKNIFITHGIQTFEDGTINEYVENYLGKNDEGEQLGGFGVIAYPDGTVEIHYDDFEDGFPSKGYGLCIDDDIVVYYETNHDSQGIDIEEYLYSSDGTRL